MFPFVMYISAQQRVRSGAIAVGPPCTLELIEKHCLSKQFIAANEHLKQLKLMNIVSRSDRSAIVANKKAR